MTEWLPFTLLFATYALAWIASGAPPPARSRRPQFDPILPTPKRVSLRLLRGTLASTTASTTSRGDRDPATHLAAARIARS